MRLIPLLLLILCSLLFGGCQKEPDDNNFTRQNNNCRPVKGWSYYTNGALSDSVRYEYTNDRLTKIHYNNDEVITYDYSGDNVIKRSFTEIGQPAPYSFQTFSYNTSGALERTVLVYEDFFGIARDSAVFSYNGGKLSAIKVYLNSTVTNGTYMLEADYNFTYTGNNITKIVNNSYTDGQINGTETTLLTFDAKPNLFRKQSSRFLQTDPFFTEADFLYHAFVLSENNVIKMADADLPSDTSEINYLTDSKGNLTEMKVDGVTGLRYAYECQ